MPLTVGARRTSGREVGAPLPPRDTHLHGRLHSEPPGSAVPAPQPGVAQRSSRTPRREARTEPRQGFILSLQIEEATSGFEPLYEALQASA